MSCMYLGKCATACSSPSQVCNGRHPPFPILRKSHSRWRAAHLAACTRFVDQGRPRAIMAEVGAASGRPTMRWGLGPVFTYEWLMLSRRWQLFALRALAVAAPGVGLFLVWWLKRAGQPLTIRGLAAMGETFFYALAGTQLALVLLA